MDSFDPLKHCVGHDTGSAVRKGGVFRLRELPAQHDYIFLLGRKCRVGPNIHIMPRDEVVGALYFDVVHVFLFYGFD